MATRPRRGPSRARRTRRPDPRLAVDARQRHRRQGRPRRSPPSRSRSPPTARAPLPGRSRTCPRAEASPRSRSGAVATLTIAEGAGAPDTAVGSFTVALSTGATGIRDAAGNLSSFAATSPADGARPVLVAGTLVMRDIDATARSTASLATFSETVEPSSDTAPWTLTNVPSAGTLSSVSTSGATATLVIARAPVLRNRGRHLPCGARRECDRYPRRRRKPGLFASTAPVDQATPVLVSLVMQDVNTNGKVDRVARHLLGDARRLQRGDRSLDARERALGRKPHLGLGPARSPPSRSPRARVLPTPPSAPSRSRSPRARPASAMLPATSPPSRPPRRRTGRGRCSSQARS